MAPNNCLMNSIFHKTISLLIVLINISFAVKAQTEYLVTVNPVTGTYVKVDSIPPVNWIALFNYTNLDENNERMFFMGSHNGSADSLFTLDLATGHTLSAVYFNTNSIASYFFSNTLNGLFGLQTIGGVCNLVAINPLAGTYTTINTIAGVQGVSSDGFTIDQSTNHLIMLGQETGGTFLVVIDAASGAVLSQAPIMNTIFGLQYDDVLHKLFGIYFQAGGGRFCSIDITTGVVTVINTLDPAITGIVGGGITYDKIHHIYYLVGGSNLYSIDVNTGLTIAKPYVDESSGLSEDNVIQFRYDNVLDTMFALHWELHTCHPGTPINISKTICPGTAYQLPSGKFISAAGTYLDTVKSSFGCDSIITALTLFFYPGSPVKDTSINASICSGMSYQLPSGIFVNNPGLYFDITTGSLGCDSIRASVSLTTYSTTFKNITTIICPGTAYQFPSGKYVTGAGIYKDTIRNSLGCDSIITTVNLSVYPNSSIASINPVICPGSSYQLPSGSFVSNQGTYKDTVRNVSGCDSMITIANLSVYPVSVYNVTDSFDQGQSYTLPSGVIVNNSGTYQSVLKDKNGCDSVISTLLTERATAGCVINIPNAFTPNGDGYNEVWVIKQPGCVQQISVDVYNRWGSMVYHSDNYNNDWNGEYQNKPVADATYYYIVKPVYADGRRPILKGSVTILR
jgi:gliding motility-associated-like protein